MRSTEKGFTLTELLIVLGIIAVLLVVAILVINPVELFARSRDTERISELQSINRAVQYADLYGLSEGSPHTVYLSLPDVSPTCASFNLPALTDGWSYACASAQNYRKTNGTGWIPVNFATTGSGIFSELPIDPVNTAAGTYYYTYTPGGSWVLTAEMESAQQLAEAAAADNGTDATRFELGTDISLWNQSGGWAEVVPAVPLTINSVSPTNGSRDTTLTVTISGTGFTSGSEVAFGGTRITVNSTTFVNSNQVTANITIDNNAQKNERDVTVTSYGSSATCSNCFTVAN